MMWCYNCGMGILKKLSKLFFAPARQADIWYPVIVKCRRCGQVIQARVNMHNDLSIEYGETGETTYICRKMLMGEDGLCFQRVEVTLRFDVNRKLLNREITGGEFVEA